MTTAKDTGGLAFPLAIVSKSSTEWYRGMTLRDYFAAKAMQSMINGSWPDSNDRAEIAKRAYSMADDMLKARQE